jgi:hypothetical protein
MTLADLMGFLIFRHRNYQPAIEVPPIACDAF